MVYIKFKFVNDFFIKFLSAVLSGTFGWELQFSENVEIWKKIFKSANLVIRKYFSQKSRFSILMLSSVFC